MRTSFHHQPESAAPNFFSYPQAGRPITPSLAHFADSKRTFPKVRTNTMQQTTSPIKHLVGARDQ